MMAQRFGHNLRVAALQPSVSLTLDHLGCLDSLVACTRYCLQAVPSLRERDLKVIADSWSSNTEEILSASPDLVLASFPIGWSPWRPSSNAASRCLHSRRTRWLTFIRISGFSATYCTRRIEPRRWSRR